MNPAIQQAREALEEMRPMAAYGVVGSRDVDQARYQRAIDAALATLRSLAEQPAEPVAEGWLCYGFWYPGEGDTEAPDPVLLPEKPKWFAHWYKVDEVVCYAASPAGRSATRVAQVPLTDEQRQSLTCSREVSIPGCATPTGNSEEYVRKGIEPT